MTKFVSKLAGRRGDPSLNLSCLQISFWSNLSFAPSQDLHCGHLLNITPPPLLKRSGGRGTPD